eukprot:433247-Amphidinium_carterae.1
MLWGPRFLMFPWASVTPLAQPSAPRTAAMGAGVSKPGKPSGERRHSSPSVIMTRRTSQTPQNPRK